MINYLHQEVELSADDVVEVTLDGQANVMLLDDANFSLYRRGEAFKYRGGLAVTSPARLMAPAEGKWHVVVDLGGYAGRVRAAIRVLQGVDGR